MKLGRVFILFFGFIFANGVEAKSKPDHRPQSCHRLFLPEEAVVYAEIEEPIEMAGFKIGVGSKMKIRVSHQKEIDGLFLGRLVGTDNKSTEYLFLDTKANYVYLLDQKKTKLKFDSKGIRSKSLQPILDPIEQVSETCSGYAIDHFLHQLQLNGFEGTGRLKERLSTEIGRRQLLVQAVNDYFIETRHQSSFKGILNTYAEEYGYKCVTLVATTADKLVEKMLLSLDAGQPLIMEFWTGVDMVNSSYQVVDPYAPRYARPGVDKRLWVPRKTGERNGGGHAIVASSYFYEPDGNRLKLLVQDSDWNEPRIWDVDKYIKKRMKSSDFAVHTCHEK